MLFTQCQIPWCQKSGLCCGLGEHEGAVSTVPGWEDGQSERAQGREESPHHFSYDYRIPCLDGVPFYALSF